MASQMMMPSLLKGNNTIPGVQVPPEILREIPGILKACRDWGLDFYPTIVEFLDYDGISEVAAYGGFPSRFPHWSWGEQYEELSRGYEFGMYRIYEMVVNCLAPNTPVLTEHGTVPASVVAVGDQLVLGGERRNVVAVVKQPVAAVKKVNLKGYGRPLVCTPNHKWKVLSETGPVWKEAGALAVGDVLLGEDAYNVHQGRPAACKWTADAVLAATRPNIRHRIKGITPPQQLTLSLAELLGAMTGDGSCGVKGNENDVYVTVGKDNAPYVSRICDLFLAVFGIPAVVHEKPSAFVVMLQSKAAVAFFDSLGLKRGCTYHDKRIPTAVWASSQEFRAAYLRGLFDTDGYACGTLGMSAYNQELVYDIQTMLLEMGIPSSVETCDNGYRRDGSRGSITALDVLTRSGKRKFEERVGFSIRNKADGLRSMVNSAYCSNGGVDVPYLARRVVEWAKEKGINTYNESSLGRSVKVLQTSCGMNVLQSFAERAAKAGHLLPADMLRLLETPMGVVASVEDGEPMETVDIALDHNDHDFVAGGWVTHNTNPCYIYCLDSNTLVDHVTVIAHATGHNDFFKNNIFFEKTDQNMMNELANHGTRIRKYMQEWGQETVGRFIDKVMMIETLLDSSKAWSRRRQRDVIPEVRRKYNHPNRLKVEAGHDYMEGWINSKEYLDQEKERIRTEELKKNIGAFEKPEKDIFGYMKDHAPLKPWQRDIISMLYEESMYFAPQGQTKMLNEGWASKVDSEIMARCGFAKDEGIVEYAIHKAGVLGGKLSMNPYKLGYLLLSDIEDRWNKGRFGKEWDDCEDQRERERWDKKLGLGHDKIFEVRQFYDDVTALSEFLTQEFCDKYEFFLWNRFPDGTYKIMERDASKIKQMLLRQYVNRGLPVIKLVEPNYRNKRIFLMEHQWDGRTLHPQQTGDTMKALSYIWGAPCAILTKDKDGKQAMFYCEDDEVKFGAPNVNF